MSGPLFGKRDLGLLLSDRIEDNVLSHTEDSTAADVQGQGLKPKLDPSRKVTRLRPHKLPEWAQTGEEEEEEVEAPGSDDEGPKRRSRKPEPAEESEDEEYRPAKEAAHVDRRLQRLAQAQIVSTGERRGRRHYEAEVIVGGSDEEEEEEAAPEEEDDYVPGDVIPGRGREGDQEEEEDEDEDAAAKRRARIRERILQARKEEAAEVSRVKPGEEAEFGEEEEDESEYETDSDEDEDEGPSTLFKPIFIPKDKRLLQKEEERLEKEEEERLEKEKKRLEERKRETRNLVAEEIRKEAENELATDGYDSEAGAPDDTDRPEDDAEELELWRHREIARIKRDEEERIRLQKEKEETERRRNMTDEERAKEDERLGKNKPKEKATWKFMQKYYHKGAFYMDEESMAEDDVRKRDFSAPTLEDKFNREAMPKVMQVKKFGRSGQTKYTHLLDQDTTQWDSSWIQSQKSNVGMANRFAHRLGGTGDLSAAAKKKKKEGEGSGGV